MSITIEDFGIPSSPGRATVTLPNAVGKYERDVPDMLRVVGNVLASRRAFSRDFDERRNLQNDCGWPELDAPPDPQQYWRLYRRNWLARRANDVLPKESWQVTPSVYEAEDGTESTPFEAAWDKFMRSQRGQSWFRQEVGSSVWQTLQRLDVLSGVGRFGVMLIGFNDGLDLRRPVRGVQEHFSMPNTKRTVAPLDRSKVYNVTCTNTVKVDGAYADLVANCGGAGSGVPGPCPTRGQAVQAKKAAEEELNKAYDDFLEGVDNEDAKHNRPIAALSKAYTSKGEHTSLGNITMARALIQRTAQRMADDSSKRSPEDEASHRSDVQTYRKVAASLMRAEKSMKVTVAYLKAKGSTANYTANYIDLTGRVEGGDGGRDGSSGWGDDGEGLRYVQKTGVATEDEYECKVNFLRVFPETLAQVVQWETNPTSPRVGQPVAYMLTLSDPSEDGGTGMPMSSVTVHWTRVIHVADNKGSSEVFGQSRIEPVIDECLDVKKVYGSSGEGYYRSCFTGMSFETHPQLGGNVKINKPALKDMWEDYSNGLDRALFLMGMSAKPIAPSVVDPNPHITPRVEAVAINAGCPVRILKGSERGELASTQDDDAWNDRLRYRQDNHITPNIIVPLVDRLIMVGVLPVPGSGFSVYWPDLTSQGRSEKATVASQMTAALISFVSGDGQTVMTLEDFYTHVLRMSEDEVKSILGNLAKRDESEVPAPSLGIDDPIFEEPVA